MAQVSGIGTTWNLPNYAGELFTADPTQTPFLSMIGGLTDVCVHYTAVDAHQNDYHIRVVTDAIAGSSKEANDASLRAIQYLQRDALVTAAEIESTLNEDVKPEDEAFITKEDGRRFSYRIPPCEPDLKRLREQVYGPEK